MISAHDSHSPSLSSFKKLACGEFTSGREFQHVIATTINKKLFLKAFTRLLYSCLDDTTFTNNGVNVLNDNGVNVLNDISKSNCNGVDVLNDISKTNCNGVNVLNDISKTNCNASLLEIHQLSELLCPDFPLTFLQDTMKIIHFKKDKTIIQVNDLNEVIIDLHSFLGTFSTFLFYSSLFEKTRDMILNMDLKVIPTALDLYLVENTRNVEKCQIDWSDLLMDIVHHEKSAAGSACCKEMIIAQVWDELIDRL